MDRTGVVNGKFRDDTVVDEAAAPSRARRSRLPHFRDDENKGSTPADQPSPRAPLPPLGDRGGSRRRRALETDTSRQGGQGRSPSLLTVTSTVMSMKSAAAPS